MKMKLRLFLLAWLLLVAMIVHHGCTGSHAPKDHITIGMVTFPGYAPLYLAKEKDLFKDIEVEFKRIESIGDLRAAMVGGKIDMYAATYDIFLANAGATPPGVGFLAIDESHGGDGVAVADHITTLEDLRGKTVGAEPGLPPYFILQYMLHKEGMSLADVDFKDLSSQDAGSAFVAGQLDAAGTYEPFLSNCISKREGAKVLVSSDNTPGLIVDWLFASPALLATNPGAAKKVADGWFAAVDYWEAHPDESMEIMAKAFGVEKTEMQDIKSGITWLDLEANKALLDKSQKHNAYDMFRLAGDILKQNGAAAAIPKPEEKISSTVIEMY